MDKVFKSLIFVNSSGKHVVLVSPSTTNLFELSGRSGFSAPEVELITQKYINGQIKVVGKIIKPRTMKINIIAKGESRAMRDAMFFQMVEDLIEVDGNNTGRLYITRSDGSIVYSNCQYLKGLDIAEKYRRFHKFSLEFYAADPYFYSNDITQTIALTEEALPITLNDNLYLNGWRLNWAAVTGGANIVTNPYAHKADPIYKISGVREDLSIINSTISKSISFNELNMSLGDVFIIDTRERQRSAYIEHPDGSTTDALGSLLWTNEDLSLPLVSGGNYLSVTSMGEPANMEVSISMTALSA